MFILAAVSRPFQAPGETRPEPDNQPSIYISILQDKEKIGKTAKFGKTFFLWTHR